MNGLQIAAGIVCVIAGIMEMFFCLFMAIYALMFGMVAVVGVVEGEDMGAVAGGVVGVIIIGVLLLLLGIAALLHIVSGVNLLRNKPHRELLWATAAGSLIPMCTVYCAALSLPAGILLLVYLLMDPAPENDPDILD